MPAAAVQAAPFLQQHFHAAHAQMLAIYSLLTRPLPLLLCTCMLTADVGVRTQSSSFLLLFAPAEV